MLELFRKLFKPNKRILIIVGGNKNKIAAFAEPSKKLGLDVTLASFSELHFASDYPFRLKIGERDVKNFDIIYIRMVGKRWEEATLLVNYAVAKRIKIVDRLYTKSLFIPSSIVKSVETAKMIGEAIPIPKAIFGNLKYLEINSSKALGYPFVIKNTIGRRAREVWLVENKSQLIKLVRELTVKEKAGASFFAQKAVIASQRLRVLVVGGKVIGAITRPTKWRKRFMSKINGEFPEGIRAAVFPLPEKDKKLAIAAAHAADLDICGVDILHDDKTKKAYVIEANAAPAWKLIAKDCQVNVEEEILKFLSRT